MFHLIGIGIFVVYCVKSLPEQRLYLLLQRKCIFFLFVGDSFCPFLRYIYGD